MDAYERIAAAWHDTMRRLSDARGWETSGRAWAEMPASYRVVMTETAERLVQDAVIARVWWR